MSKPNRKKVTGIAVCLLAAAGAIWLVQAGELEPPGPPAPTMTTLEEIGTKVNALVAAHSIYQFVGVATATTVQGDVGWKAMGNLCVAELGATYPSIRMCFSEELMRTPPGDWPALGGASGYWMQPTYQSISTGTTGDGWILDLSGVHAFSSLGSLSCFSWRTAAVDQYGLSIESSGHIFNLPCNNNFGITCCAPQDELP